MIEVGKKNKTTLAYIEQGNSYLMLHRTKKKADPNEGKWIGVGGHVERGESIQAAMKREIMEETGLRVLKSRYVGYVDFLNSQCPSERMYIYKVPSWDGEMIECNEGELKFVDKAEIANLNLWEGDRVFMPLLESDANKPFGLTLIYEGNDLKEVIGPFYKPDQKKKPKKKKGRRNGRNKA
ncbi:MAG: 8-oxo-dGTP diphosphatase [Bacilli bacterium]|nr:8-oxo-dGTP diphosphatase [Bacilli bacterium]